MHIYTDFPNDGLQNCSVVYARIAPNIYTLAARLNRLGQRKLDNVLIFAPVHDVPSRELRLLSLPLQP
jgi:hypothetical protein